MKRTFFLLLIMCVAMAVHARTLIVYYSYTNNIERIVTDLSKQIEADVVEIEPAEKGLNYAANNYAIGSALISAIRNNPDNAASYPAIDPVNVNLYNYDMVIVAAPLWWNNMAAPLQTYLFHNGAKMARKKIGLIVSSASSGINGVEADARRLIPGGDFVSPSLWIKSSQTADCHSKTADWLKQIDYSNLAGTIENIAVNAEPAVEIIAGTLRVTGDFDSLSLYNLSGTMILESTDSETDISTLPRGVYVASVSSNQKNFSTKIKL